MPLKNIMKFILFSIIVALVSISLISAVDFPIATAEVSVGFNDLNLPQVNIMPEVPIFNNETLGVNHSTTSDFATLAGTADFAFNWITDEGTMNNVPDLYSTLDGRYLQLTGGTMSGDINMNSNNLDSVSNITINDNIFFGDINHFLKRGTTNFDGLSTNAFSFQQNTEHPEGTIPFVVSVNKTNSITDAVLIMAQSGLNESNGVLGNSWFVVVNNLTSNLTKYSNCFFVAGLLNKTLRVQCDSADSGADLIAQDDIQSFGTMFADGGIRAETLASFIMNGNDFSIQNGTLHIATPTTFETGVTRGDEIITFDEEFSGNLGSFINLQDDFGNWFETSNVLCDDGDCANAIGISGVGNIIMESNISTLNINTTSLNFIYSLSNMLGANDFTVTVNNNVGSGEVTLLTDSTNDVIKLSQSIAMPSSMSDQPKVSLRFNCDVTNTNRQCFVDTIVVNGTAIDTTLTNQSGFNSIIKFGSDAVDADGFPERGIIYNASSDEIIFRGNVTFALITEQDINVTNSIELNATTIFDWADVLSSPNFPTHLLANGSTPLTGSWQVDTPLNPFNINMSGNVSANTGFFNFIGSLTSRVKQMWIEDISFNGTINDVFWNTSLEDDVATYNLFLGGIDGTESQAVIYDLTEFTQLNATGVNATFENITSNFNFPNRLGVGIINPISIAHIYEDTSGVSASSGLTIEQDGTGDAILQFLLTAEARLVMGLDNDDDNILKIAPSQDVGTGTIWQLDMAGDVINFGDLQVNGVMNGTIDTSAKITVAQGILVGSADSGYYFDHTGAPITSKFYANGSNIFFSQGISAPALNKYGFNASFGFEMFNDARVHGDLLVESQMFLGSDGVISSDRIMDIDNGEGAISFGAVYTPERFGAGGTIAGIAFRGDVGAGFAVTTSQGARILNPAIGGDGSLVNAYGLAIDRISSGSSINVGIITQNSIQIDQDNEALEIGENQELKISLDSSSNGNMTLAGSGIWTFNNGSGLGTIRVGDVVFSTPELSSSASSLQSMKNPSLITRNGKTEVEFHKSFPDAVQTYIPITDESTCQEVIIEIEYCYDERLICEPTSNKDLKELYGDEEIVEHKTIECGTEPELVISGGMGYLDNYNLIYQLKEYIEQLEARIIALESSAPKL